MNKIFNNKIYNFFPDVFVYIGYILILTGIAFIIEKSFFSILLILLGILFSFSYVGILIDMTNNIYKNYFSFFGIKKGVWKTYNKFTDICILEFNQKNKGYSRTGLEFSSKKLIYRICLLDSNHQNKILINELKSKEKAIAQAKELSVKMNKSLNVFNPTISDSTRLKRR
ncbi:hypothetical protein [Tamlana sp. I1]|uniref:hypothetical protein n=1 Tax=Tamlana sp. I1 TaxID=2762061 RepID=UPI00188F4811|nr:hypothetical protein [Tamlana sp. I1]